MIVTQLRIGEETASLEQRAPRLWALPPEPRGAILGGGSRRSTGGQPPFAIFGVGPYSFAPYKVAVSGLHTSGTVPGDRPGGRAGRSCSTTPATCSPAGRPDEAAVLAALCNDPITLDVIRSLSFGDAKRPVTKGLLQRIDLSAILDRADRAELVGPGRGRAARGPRAWTRPTGRRWPARSNASGTSSTRPVRTAARRRTTRPTNPHGDDDREDNFMAFARINYYSRSLQKASSVSVVFPDDPDDPPALVGLLPAPRALGRRHDLDAADEHRALRRGPAPGRRDARRRPRLVHQRRRSATPTRTT